MNKKQKRADILEKLKNWCADRGDEHLEDYLNELENELNGDDFETNSGSNPPGLPTPNPPLPPGRH